ncbi:MAG: hypothetical protein EOP87_04270 [Verrucomicrobiaceae bacterium]|nr:MAG: hypothetical protein EOP87_04270 [Verrucomicrobiaceae bacterium]
MTSISSDTPVPPSIEDGVNALIDDAKHKASDGYHRCEQRVRESPGKAILFAVGAGYLLHRLPVRSLLVSQVRVVAALAPPVLVAFGAAKLCEYLQGQARRRRPAAARALSSRSSTENPAASPRTGNVAGGFDYEPPI